MAFEVTRQEILKQAIALNLLWKQTRDQKYRDEELRLRRISLELDSIVLGGTGVTQIVAGTNVTISPTEGTGVVTISAVDISIDPTGYGSFFSNQDQSLAAINTPQIVTFNNTYEGNNVSLSSNRIIFDKAGTYQFSFIASVFNSSNGVENCDFWIKYNGVDFPNSGIMMTLKERKSSTEPSEQQMKLILSGTAQNDGDYIELYWQGTSTSLELGYVPAGANSPVNSPSVIANIIPIGAQGRDSNLNELNDVNITSLVDNQLLRYDSTDQKWENWTPDFLTVETDPTVPSHVKSISTTDIDNWDSSYDNMITSVTITGDVTKTINLNQQDGGVVSVSYNDTYVHTQGAPSSSWLVTHDMNKYPSVTVVDSSDNVVEGEVEYNSLNTLTINFSGGFSGKAYIN